MSVVVIVLPKMEDAKKIRKIRIPKFGCLSGKCYFYVYHRSNGGESRLGSHNSQLDSNHRGSICRMYLAEKEKI